MTLPNSASVISALISPLMFGLLFHGKFHVILCFEFGFGRAVDADALEAVLGTPVSRILTRSLVWSMGGKKKIW